MSRINLCILQYFQLTLHGSAALQGERRLVPSLPFLATNPCLLMNLFHGTHKSKGSKTDPEFLRVWP